MSDLRWCLARDIDVSNLTPDEAEELDTLIFRGAADLPFGPAEEARMIELEKKAGQSA